MLLEACKCEEWLGKRERQSREIIVEQFQSWRRSRRRKFHKPSAMPQRSYEELALRPHKCFILTYWEMNKIAGVGNGDRLR